MITALLKKRIISSTGFTILKLPISKPARSGASKYPNSLKIAIIPKLAACFSGVIFLLTKSNVPKFIKS